MAAERFIAGGRDRARANPAGTAEMMMMSNGNNSNKVLGAGRGATASTATASAYRWHGDAVPLKRRRVGLSNSGSMSEAGSDDDEEEEEEEEEEEREEYDVAAAEELSSADEEADGGIVGREEEEDEDEDAAAAMARVGGSTSSRGQDPLGFDDHDVGTDEDYFQEDNGVPDSYVLRDSERPIEMSSPDEGHSPDEAREISDGSDEDRAITMSGRIFERGQASASEGYREMVAVPEKAVRGMMDTAKRKVEVIPRNAGELKPKKPRAPSSSKKKSNGEVTRERARFSTDTKARVTLERAREILASVKAAMMKDPKHFAMRHTHVAENSSSSDDEGVPMQLAPPRLVQQAKTEEKVVKKRTKAPKGEKEPNPRRRKPKVEIDYHCEDEKTPYCKRNGEGAGHEHSFKIGHFSTSGVEFMREGRDVDDGEKYEREFQDDGYDQQLTVVEKKVRKRRKTKESDNGPSSSTGLCPGSVLRNEDWVPPTSPFGLIQESLYKDPWKVLLSCMLLNKTAGRQMHKVIWDLFSLCPDAQTAVNMDTAKIAEKVYSLGLQNKRAKMIQRFSLEYVRGDWTNVTQLHGIGKYAADAYAIFCQGLWREVEPDDLMLSKYWKWLWDTQGMGSAFTPDTS